MRFLKRLKNFKTKKQLIKENRSLQDELWTLNKLNVPTRFVYIHDEKRRSIQKVCCSEVIQTSELYGYSSEQAQDIILQKLVMYLKPYIEWEFEDVLDLSPDHKLIRATLYIGVKEEK